MDIKIKKERILVTSALPYVNNVPHLGNIVGAVLSADVFARFCRSIGHEIIYICGTDEHGTATETKALEEGVTPKEICDKYHKIHKDIYDWFSISFDSFGRTSTKEQTEITQDIFLKLHKRGYIKEDEVEQLYCENCKKFLADRYVEGECPFCGYNDARGDQCDSCGKLLNAVELKNPRCKICNEKPIIKTSEHLFIDLPKLEPKILDWLDKRSEDGQWSSNAKTITYAWIKEGLKKRAISRDLKWGIPIPLEKYKDKVFYVWFDAPIGYISITKKAFSDWKEWWFNDYNKEKDEGVKLYQFMGKDNIPFHTIIFPASLLGSGEPYTMLYKISSTEYLNYEDGKFSKSRGTGVFGDQAKDTGIESDVFRYYLLINRPEKSDSSFQWKDLQDKNNNELVANYGNLVNRTITFIKKFFDCKVPKGELNDEDKEFWNNIEYEYLKVTKCLQETEIKEGLKHIMHISKLGNQYFQENEPWKIFKEDKERAGTVMYLLANLTKDLAILIEPYLPKTADKIFGLLNVEKLTWKNLAEFNVESGHKIKEPEILFRKVEDEDIEKLDEKFKGDDKMTEEEKVFPLDLAVAKIEYVEDHPDADKLYIVKIDLGNEKRQIVAGLKPYIPREELLGKKIVVVKNLEKAKLRGAVSEAMLLAAEKDGKVEALSVEDSKIGDKVYFDGVESSDKEISFKDFQAVRMTVKDGKVILDGKFLQTDKEEVSAGNIPDGGTVR